MLWNTGLAQAQLPKALALPVAFAMLGTTGRAGAQLSKALARRVRVANIRLMAMCSDVPSGMVAMLGPTGLAQAQLSKALARSVRVTKQCQERVPSVPGERYPIS